LTEYSSYCDVSSTHNPPFGVRTYDGFPIGLFRRLSSHAPQYGSVRLTVVVVRFAGYPLVLLG
jgi:hypothetical protein